MHEVRQLLLVVCLLPLCAGELWGQTQTILFDGAHLDDVRSLIRSHPASFETATDELRQLAEDVIDAGPWSVVGGGPTPPSGDVHDYTSIGPYWWPDSSQPDGLPYIRRDGRVNPERKRGDSLQRTRMVDAVKSLSHAWFFLGDAAAADRAAQVLRVWFLDDATRMNPNLNFGQAIPGITQGRHIGIIDTVSFISMLDAVEMLRDSESWTEDDHRGLQTWFAQYTRWLRESEIGILESQTGNNHAVWYDAQVARFSLFSEDPETAKAVLANVGPRRIATQIEPDGRMPRELERTKSLGYSWMNLSGFLTLARMGEHVGVDLWTYQASADEGHPDRRTGASIKAALEFLEPYTAQKQKWRWPQITSPDWGRGQKLYRQAATHYETPAFDDLSAKWDDPVGQLFYPK